MSESCEVSAQPALVPQPDWCLTPITFANVPENTAFYVYYERANICFRYIKERPQRDKVSTFNAILDGKPSRDNPKEWWFAEDEVVFVDQRG